MSDGLHPLLTSFLNIVQELTDVTVYVEWGGHVRGLTSTVEVVYRCPKYAVRHDVLVTTVYLVVDIQRVLYSSVLQELYCRLG